MPTYSSSAHPGQCINLLAGLSYDSNSPFIRSLDPGFTGQIAELLSEISGEIPFGPFPDLTPCDNWSALLTALFSRFEIQGRPLSFASRSVLRAHTTGAGKIYQDLTNWLGVRAEDATDAAGAAFVLARVTRRPERSVAELGQGTSDFKALAGRFGDHLGQLQAKLNIDARHPEDIPLSPDHVNAALAFAVQGFGSHAVTSVGIGDEALQVFVFDRNQYQIVCQSAGSKGWSGPRAMGFRYSTSSKYTKYPTPVRLLSGPQNLAKFSAHLKDAVYELDQSVFMLLADPDAAAGAAKLESLTCIGAKCVPVGALAATAPPRSGLAFHAASPNTSRLQSVAGLVDDVAVQGAIAAFGGKGAGGPAVSNDNATDFAKIYAPFYQPQTVSLLWSPHLSISQMYVRLDELWSRQAMNQDGVKSLVIVADVIEIAGTVDLSKMKDVVLSCRRFIARASSQDTPSVILSGSAWKPLRFYCNSMSGTCVFQNASLPEARRVVFSGPANSLEPAADSVSYEGFFSGKFPTAILTAKSDPLFDEWIRSSAQAGLETLLLSASAVLSHQGSLAGDGFVTASEAWLCLNWILDYTRAALDTGAVELTALRAVFNTALVVARGAREPRPGFQPLAQVPGLRYPAYKDSIDKYLAVAEDYSRQISEVNSAIRARNETMRLEFQLSKVNENIRSMGVFLIEQTEALAKKEDDLRAHSDGIVNKTEDRIGDLGRRITESGKDVKTRSEALNQSKKELSDAVQRYVDEQMRKATLDFIFSFTEAAIGMASFVADAAAISGTSENVTKLNKAKAKWEAAAKFFACLNSLYESVNGVKEAGEDLRGYQSVTVPGSLTETALSDADWDIFVNDAEAEVKSLETIVTAEHAAFIAALRNLAVTGKQGYALRRELGQAQLSLTVEKSSRLVNDNQAKRLRELKQKLSLAKLDPADAYAADLGRFNAVLQQKQSSVLLQLVQLVTLQDQSMTFHYLSEPTPITQFDLSGIRVLLASQALRAQQALEHHNPPPTDLKGEIKYVAGDIPFERLNSPEGVEIEIPLNAETFMNFVRVRMNSVDIRIAGVQSQTGECSVEMVSTGEPMYDRNLEREPVSYRMSPRKWRVVYEPASDVTKIGTRPAEEWGRFFTKPTPFQKWRIRLPRTSENRDISCKSRFTTVELRFSLEAIYAPVEHRSKLLQAGPTDCIARMQGHSITGKWDVATFVSLDQINALWSQRWKAETAAAFLEQDRTFIQKLELETPVTTGNVKTVYFLSANMGPPKLQFLPDSATEAMVEIPILNGSLKITVYYKGKLDTEDILPIVSTAANPQMVRGRVSMEKLQGEVSGGAVTINPQKGVFGLSKVHMDLDPVVDQNLAERITSYFKEQKLKPWIIGSVRNEATQEYLKPKGFRFATFAPQESRKQEWPAILGIFINTTSPAETSHPVERKWPEDAWPVSKEFDGTVFFSSNLLWNQYLKPSLASAIASLSGTGVTIIDGVHGTHSAKLSGKVQVFDQEVRINGSSYHQTVSFDFKDIEVAANLTSIELSCNGRWDERLPYEASSTSCRGGSAGSCTTNRWAEYATAHMSCTFSNSTAAKLDTSTAVVTFSQLSVSPVVEARLDGDKSSAFGSWGHISNNVTDRAKTLLRDTVAKIKVDLGSLCLFAVTNLLFPESKTIDPKSVMIPGDLVLIGNVVREWKKPALQSGSALTWAGYLQEADGDRRS